MKTILVAVGLVAATSAGVFAQTVEQTLVAEGSSKKSIPESVLKAYEHDFPDGKAISDWKLLPKQVLDEKFAITQLGDDSMKGATDVYYTIDLNGKNIHGQAVYNQNGRLISFTEKASNVTLPTEVVDAIEAKYPEARITTDHEKIHLNAKGQEIRYLVHFVQDKKHGYALTNETGVILKSRL